MKPIARFYDHMLSMPINEEIVLEIPKYSFKTLQIAPSLITIGNVFLNECACCKSTGIEQDLSSGKPCISCGGVVEFKVKRGQWVSQTENKGYWDDTETLY